MGCAQTNSTVGRLCCIGPKTSSKWNSVAIVGSEDDDVEKAKRKAKAEMKQSSIKEVQTLFYILDFFTL